MHASAMLGEQDRMQSTGRYTSNLETVKLSVADQGIGIAEDELPSLFTRYGRTASAVTARIERHGVGLFLCKGIVEAHGGRIWVESPGAGPAVRRY